MPSDYQFALPGLMALQTPISDTLTLVHSLDPHSVVNSLWQGIVTIGPIVTSDATPLPDAVSAELEFSTDSDFEHIEYVLTTTPDGGQGNLTITDATTWLFEVPEQPLPLSPALWYWRFKVTDASEETQRIYRGTLLVTP